MHPAEHRSESCCYEIRIILSPKGLSWTGTTKPSQGSHPKEDQEDIHTSLDGITGVGQEQARTPPVLGLALAIAEEIGLEPKQKEVFINFMAARFPSELDELYIKEWAGRFWRNRELEYCDKDSAAVLLSIHRTFTGENPLLNIEAKH